MATQPTVIEPEIDKETGKFVYSYQPRDSEGQFIGKPYRFLYTDQQDLIKQITDAKENGDRFIYEVKTGKRKLQGEPAVPVPEFKPAPETDDEAERKQRESFRKVVEQEFGAPVEEVRNTFKMQRETAERLIAQNWAMNKEAEGYYICMPNARAMGKYLKENNLKPCPENYDFAFEALKEAVDKDGNPLLISRPQETPADSTQQQPPTKAEVRPQSTGIIPGQFQGTRQMNRQEKTPLTRERFREIDKMSRDQWLKLQRVNPKESQAFLAMKHPAQPQQ